MEKLEQEFQVQVADRVKRCVRDWFEEQKKAAGYVVWNEDTRREIKRVIEVELLEVFGEDTPGEDPENEKLRELARAIGRAYPHFQVVAGQLADIAWEEFSAGLAEGGRGELPPQEGKAFIPPPIEIPLSPSQEADHERYKFLAESRVSSLLELQAWFGIMRKHFETGGGALILSAEQEVPAGFEVSEISRFTGESDEDCPPSECPVFSLETVINTDPRDWSIDKDNAWIYGIVIGWGDALSEVAAKHRWSSEDVGRLRRMRARFKKFRRYG